MKPSTNATNGLLCGDTDRVLIAKQRWKILSSVLLGHKLSDIGHNPVSVRRFSNFGLLETRCMLRENTEDFEWYEYISSYIPNFSMAIRHLSGKWKPEALQGFNNTGNVCVWPSEEVMAYYCLNNLEKFCDKRVLELGGGMTCLAGIALATHSEVRYVELTDGNEESVDNLSVIVHYNKEGKAFGDTTVAARLLRWGSDDLTLNGREKFDFILCADCMFFKEGRQALVDLMYSLLKPKGEVIMFAPRRGSTFDDFISLASKAFSVHVKENYNNVVWDIHCKMQRKGKEVYDDNIHYPLYVSMKKIP
ncbi:hypothetical protein ScPMuIL_013613 [Solemya velum]